VFFNYYIQYQFYVILYFASLFVQLALDVGGDFVCLFSDFMHVFNLIILGHELSIQVSHLTG